MEKLRRLFGGLGLFIFAMGLIPTVSASSLEADIDQRAKQIESKVIAWRRDIHPREISNGLKIPPRR
jgi:hypothetical protein